MMTHDMITAMTNCCQARDVIALWIVLFMTSTLYPSATALDVSQSKNETLLHFIWIQPGLITTKHETGSIKRANADAVAEEWMATLKQKQYKLVFWTDKDIHDHFPDLVRVLSKISVSAWISDVLRYHILYQYGGVYLDTDVRAVRDFTKLTERFRSGFSVCEAPQTEPGALEPIHTCELLINAIIFAPARHPALKCAADRSLAYSMIKVSRGAGSDYALEGTGPPRWTTCVRQKGGIAVLPSWTFLPCPFSSRDSCNPAAYQNSQHPEIFGMHEWTFSWAK